MALEKTEISTPRFVEGVAVCTPRPFLVHGAETEDQLSAQGLEEAQSQEEDAAAEFLDLHGD